MKKYISILLGAMLAAVLGFQGCREVEIIEETVTLEIAYYTLTVYPNQGTVTSTPEIITGEPSDFSIIEVFNGETDYDGDEFSIDSATGAVSVNATDDTPAGEYTVSISCNYAGRNYILKNAVTVNIISGMPEQITVSPATLNMRYEDLQTGSAAELATASVVTAGESAAITGYELRNLRIRGDEADTPIENINTYFTISQDGVISAVKSENWQLATYVMDVKVNTESFGSQSEEGLIQNALTVNVAAAVITVTYPAEPEYIAPNLTRTYEAVVDGPAEGGPQVTDFTITEVYHNDAAFQGVFTVDSATGKITAAAGADMEAGDYAISISYKYAGQTLHATDILTVHCRPGTPETLTVTPAAASIELPDITASTGNVYGTFQVGTSGESAAITGYEISAVKLDGSAVSYDGLISIDAQSGVISVLTGSSWQIGNYTVDVKVNTESYGSSDADRGVFTDALTVSIVSGMIFNYDSAADSHKFATSWSVTPESTLNNAVYSWTDAQAAYTQHLTLDSSTGAISAVKGNELATGNYEVQISATVSGNEPVSATYSFSVVENPYYFTHFSYGNNLGLSEEETDGVSQFRVNSASELAELTLAVDYTKGDLKEAAGAKFSQSRKNALSGISTASGTGNITFTTNGYSANGMGLAFITAKTQDPDDAENTWSVTIPLFVHCAAEINGVNVQYSPFVARVNPLTQTEVRSAAPVIGGSTPANLTYLDYRRTFNYLNINGVDSEGADLVSGSLSNANAPNFMSGIWDAFYATVGGTPNYGAKYPVSYFYSNGTTVKTEAQMAASPCYVDNTEGENQFSLVIHPDKWNAGGAADGVFYGQMTFATALGNSLNGGSQIFPFAIWFDKDFNE